MSQQLEIINEPKAQELWAGIGGHFDNLGQILNEFIDNSISNFAANSVNSRNILITIEETSSNTVSISIEDTGTGIKCLNDAFTLGCQSSAESPLNEHGFVLKHALASANPENDTWSIYTRTEDDKKLNQYKIIKAPYKIKGFSGEIEEDSQWPGRYNGTGTIVKFQCSQEMFKTIARGLKGGYRAFLTIADILCEDLGFVYSGVIQNAGASITLEIIDQKGTHLIKPVGAVIPNWGDSIKPGQGSEKIDLGGGDVVIEYRFGCINEAAQRVEFDNSTNRKYYLRNMSSSGVEIRINGRVLCYNLFKEIWGIEKHNSYNYLLVSINLKSNNKEALPKTRTSKNGLREGDKRLEALYGWILSRMTEPKKDVTLSDHETDLFETLKDFKIKFNPDPNKVLETEKYVFTSTGSKKDHVRLDLYEITNGVITVYEGKKDVTTSKDVYQLRMYWDGLIYDGVTPNKGILVAQEHPDPVKNMIQIVNTMQDANGNNYNLETRTWKELGID